jgi:hypothetical protein
MAPLVPETGLLLGRPVETAYEDDSSPAKTGGGIDFEVVGSVPIDDHLRTGRSWTPLETDLSWFGSPRIALEPGSPQSATQWRSH